MPRRASFGRRWNCSGYCFGDSSSGVVLKYKNLLRAQVRHICHRRISPKGVGQLQQGHLGRWAVLCFTAFDHRRNASIAVSGAVAGVLALGWGDRTKLGCFCMSSVGSAFAGSITSAFATFGGREAHLAVEK
jgi:hypothetical protein